MCVHVRAHTLFFLKGNLNELGKLLMQGSFNVWIDHKKGHSKVKDLARFKPMQRHLFLHEKAILFCKKREENGEGYEKAPSYSFKNSLNVRFKDTFKIYRQMFGFEVLNVELFNFKYLSVGSKSSYIGIKLKLPCFYSVKVVDKPDIHFIYLIKPKKSK